MSLETEIKEAFERHAGDALPAGDTWTGIERRIQRSHRTRAILAGAGAAIAIAAVVLAVPRIGNKPTGPITPGPVSTAGWKSYEDPSSNYKLLFPSDWQRTGETAFMTFTPPHVGKPAFEVHIALLGQTLDDITAQPGTRTQGTLGGRRYVKYERPLGTGRFVMVFIDWPPAPSCKPGSAVTTSRWRRVVALPDRDGSVYSKDLEVRRG